MNNTARALLRTPSGWEFHFEGESDYVESLTLKTIDKLSQEQLRISSPKHSENQMQLFPESDNTPLLAEGNVLTLSDKTEVSISLVELYKLVSPKNQMDQVLTIAYFYRIHKGYASVTPKDIEDGYRELRYDTGKPSKVADAIGNALKNRDKYFRRDGSGQYILTNQGVEYIEKILSSAA